MDSDDWRAYREIGRTKRKRNRDNSTHILDENNIHYDSHNGGVHLVVKHNNFIADFWPSTGKYIVRGSQKYKRGVYNLLKDIK